MQVKFQSRVKVSSAAAFQYTCKVCIMMIYITWRSPMNRRLNITLPEQTVRMLDRAAPRGQRSRLIDEAVRHFVNEQGRANLRNQLALGAAARSERDREIAEEWFVLPDLSP